MLLSPLAGGLWSWSWQGALTAFFWCSLVRVAVLHHVTFAINSLCHVVGRGPFNTKDESRNVWWLALPSMGESWHNFHRAVTQLGTSRGRPLPFRHERGDHRGDATLRLDHRSAVARRRFPVGDGTGHRLEVDL